MMKLGDKVICTAVLKRRTQTIRGWHMKKFWEPRAIKPRGGVYIGLRHLANGERWIEDEVGYVFETKERLRAALVVFSTRENPVLVPLDAMQEVAE